MLAERSKAIEITLDGNGTPHQSVLLAESLALLAPRAGGTFVDATLGPGGHAEALLDAVGEHGKILGIDRDPAAVAYAERRLARFGDRFVGVVGDYQDVETIARDAGLPAVDGVLADLGISSLQLDDPARGFSFQLDAPLDMRMNPASGGPTAAELIATLPEHELSRILAEWGEERAARRVARAIVRERALRPIETTAALSALVSRVVAASSGRFRIHPATRTFQALRIAVNRELEGIAALVRGASSLLRAGGRLAVISFHSLEDRAVKSAIRGLTHPCVCPPDLPVCVCGRTPQVRSLAPRPTVPSEHEIRRNPRARSARLRGLEKI
ncbi:MAG TPA: 16S rRNA (cytosine(1402)-N(4))-methyltransferase RsmH [Candidatus Polarisedimenticolaceae bacterium]|nr:16S rRNA (cytosine(1402)-N(4))-methyltransferase RsmH [Candidatus Polarisedimenticolaceae bacterium]